MGNVPWEMGSFGKYKNGGFIMKKENKELEQELNQEAEEMAMDDDELDQVSGGALNKVHINKTSDISDSVKKRI